MNNFENNTIATSQTKAIMHKPVKKIQVAVG